MPRCLRATFIVLCLSAALTLTCAAGASAQDLSGFTIGATSSATLSGATISSDKADYAPGDHVVLTGTGWQPGESVSVYVNDDQNNT